MQLFVLRNVLRLHFTEYSTRLEHQQSLKCNMLLYNIHNFLLCHIWSQDVGSKGGIVDSFI